MLTKLFALGMVAAGAALGQSCDQNCKCSIQLSTSNGVPTANPYTLSLKETNSCKTYSISWIPTAITPEPWLVYFETGTPCPVDGIIFQSGIANSCNVPVNAMSPSYSYYVYIGLAPSKDPRIVHDSSDHMGQKRHKQKRHGPAPKLFCLDVTGTELTHCKNDRVAQSRRTKNPALTKVKERDTVYFSLGDADTVTFGDNNPCEPSQASKGISSSQPYCTIKRGAAKACNGSAAGCEFSYTSTRTGDKKYEIRVSQP